MVIAASFLRRVAEVALLAGRYVSGLALYFLNRLVELDVCAQLPSAVIERLQQNMMDNTRRTHGMIAESVSIQREFQEADLSYAILKGLSLTPDSVPRPELRHQFDLDYLIAEKDAPKARQILERRGYRLYAISGRSWEFKMNEKPRFSDEGFLQRPARPGSGTASRRG